MQPLRELEARVRDVDAARQHRHADRFDRLDFGVHQGQDDVDIVDHQVEDDVDVEAPLGKRSQAMDLDEPRIAQQRARRGDGGIEALGLADGEKRLRLRRRGDHLVGLGKAARHRLLDQHVDAGREKRQRDFPMELGRHGERHRVDASEDVAIVSRGTGSAGSGHLRRPRLVGVDDRYQLHARQRGQNPGVMAAEVADADDGYSQRHRLAIDAFKPRRHEEHEESVVQSRLFVVFVTSCRLQAS